MKLDNINSRRTNSNNLILNHSAGFTNNLMVIKTGSKRKMLEEIEIDLRQWLQNKCFDSFRDKLIDLAIIIYLDKLRYKKQDLDNISKIVLDSIKRSRKYPDRAYLINDDSQIVRLLIYKLKRLELADTNTSEIIISFRIHSPKKGMTLVNNLLI